jgi:hypothetical protein
VRQVFAGGSRALDGAMRPRSDGGVRGIDGQSWLDRTADSALRILGGLVAVSSDGSPGWEVRGAFGDTVVGGPFRPGHILLLWDQSLMAFPRLTPQNRAMKVEA